MKKIGLGVALALVVAGVLAAVGCNTQVSCASYCEDRKSANCSDVASTDCNSVCADRNTAVTAAGADCAKLYQDFLSCADTSESVCSVGAAGDPQCGAEVQQYNTCLGAYCNANKGATGCSGPDI